MNRVLVLAYYYPPLGGAGVQRTVKLLKYLPSLGYEATVVTGPDTTSVDWAPADNTLFEDVPRGTVVRRAYEEPPPLSRSRAARWLARPSPFSRWWVEQATTLGREFAGGMDVVYASMSPFETATAAATIAKEAQLPWIADLRDPWALDEWAVYPTAVHRRLDERRMRAVLRKADAVILNTPEAAREVVHRFPELSNRVTTVPNGWDAEDFAGPAPLRNDGAFRIVHVGYLHHSQPGPRWSAVARALAGGRIRGLDIRSRSHIYLLEAVRRLRLEEPAFADRIELHLAGPERPTVDDSDASFIRDHGYLAHRDAVDLVRSADLLFLPMHDLPPGLRARAVPGKTYEYLASGRPILAALPDGDARDLLGGLSHVRICRPNDVHEMIKSIRACLENPPRDSGTPTIALAYERQRLAADLASVFDSLMSSDRRRAGVS